MPNRLLDCLKKAEEKKEKLFCAFLTLGYPSLQATENLIIDFEKIGVDILELGIPFSDPLADGPTIQYSSEYALRHKVTLEKGLDFVRKLRQKGVRLPLICFTYLNPVYQYGIQKFPERAKQAGFEGLIIPDLPPEAEAILNARCRKADLAQIFLMAPTTSKKRMRLIEKNSRGFLYYVSLRGVTGARKALPSAVKKEILAVRRKIKKPMLVGFGVSSPEQSRFFSHLSQGVIVGSAIIDRIRKNKDSIDGVRAYVQSMVRAAKSAR